MSTSETKISAFNEKRDPIQKGTSDCLTTYQKDTRQVKQSSLLGNVLILYCMQMGLALLVLLEVSRDEKLYELPNDSLIVASRFVCGIVLHVFLQGELE